VSLDAQERMDLMEIIANCDGPAAIIIGSRLPVSAWFDVSARTQSPMLSLTASFTFYIALNSRNNPCLRNGSFVIQSCSQKKST
jgi:hypothetical protein